MTKLSFAVSPIALEAQGQTFSVDPADFAPLALEGIFAYGVRRWFQDNINSAAHSFKLAAKEAADKGEAFNGGLPFDVTAAFNARLESAKTGILSTRRASNGQTFTAFDDALYLKACEVKAKLPAIAKALADSKGAAVSDRKLAVLAAVKTLPDAARTKLEGMAQAHLDALAAFDF